MILKIVFTAIICIFVSSITKKYNQEISSLINVCGGVVLFLFCIDELSNVVIYFNELFNQVGFDSNYFELIFKVLGVGYIVEFTADIAEDFGNSAIASKVILGGKIIICGMTLPIIKNLLSSLLLFLS